MVRQIQNHCGYTTRQLSEKNRPWAGWRILSREKETESIFVHSVRVAKLCL